tara:strand:- start:13511 stop:13969 length:459 start_codon:yes stop_codon:yes gene_type:complete
MKFFKSLVFIAALSLSFAAQSQESEASNNTTIDKKAYYQQRAIEDANYEQQFSAEVKADEEVFWKDQKAYEEDLKRKDRKAYRTYMKGKKDAYASHYKHCDNHCHHSDYYYHHASFYYYGYHEYNYQRSSYRRNSINTSVRLNTPSVRVGLF